MRIIRWKNSVVGARDILPGTLSLALSVSLIIR
jgi:hypothetical protein